VIPLRTYRLAAGTLACAMTLALPAQAQTGVSDDRVSLPDGPGSLDGMGDNASADGNMGQMSFSVPIDVEGAYVGLTPSLSLSYSSGGGASELGIGWSMSMPSIERMTSRGLPEYIADDIFVAGGGEELVRVSGPSDEPLVYRARFEGGFVRYSWHNRGSGNEGYWTAESPSGFTTYFGADSDGNPVETSRVRSPDGVFRYLAKETVDLFGHSMEYVYSQYGAVPLIDMIAYAHDSNGTPTLSVTFDYEAREDRIADASGGFNELLAHRLSAIRVHAGGEQLRMYQINYEDYATSGGTSRISSVQKFGRDGGLYPLVNSFQYSKALGGQCTATDCEQPYLVDLGNVGNNVLESGQGTLMDMNGDSLPDLVVSAADGSPHTIYMAELAADGTHSLATPFSSSIAASGSFQLADNTVQEVDYDGDGIADLVDHVTGVALVNKGTGDWFGTELVANAAGGLNTDSGGDFDDSTAPNAGDGELKNIKYLDYDGDRRIDILRAAPGSPTSILRNLGAGGYTPATNVDDIGASFEDDNLELADMNGDGLLDPVKLQVAGIEYKLNLGRGRWSSTWTPVTNSPIQSSTDLPFTSFEDMNGDGIDDIVVVSGTEIRYAINRNGASFDPVVTFTTAGGVAIPVRDATVSVLFADMNGNGSNDVVWVDGSGNVTYLEMFPVRPNLLARIENGLGKVTEVEYSSSVTHRARDLGVGWDNPLPNANIVVDSIDTWYLLGDEALEQHSTRQVRVTGGFYDGVEKQFRGYEVVVVDEPGDEHQEAMRIVSTYDVGDGVDRAHRAGRMLTKEFFSEDEPVQRVENTYDDCTVAGVPTSGLTRPIVWTCQTASRTIHQERLPASEWVETLDESTYDGYGNVSTMTRHGIVSIGGGACEACDAARVDGEEFGAPCGAQCLGDEQYIEKTYLEPTDTSAWLLRLNKDSRGYSDPAGRKTHTRFYYDGDAFVGLPHGQATVGALTRVEEAVADGEYLSTNRYKIDAHGNVIEEMSPRGTVGSDSFLARYTYDDAGLDIVEEEKIVTGADGTYSLKRSYTLDSVFGGYSAGTDWYVAGEDPSATTKRFAYDEFGRLSTVILPGGDTASSPSEEYVYELGTPFSRIVTRQRTEVGGPFDLERVSCHDGAGRVIQRRARIDDSSWYVSGLSIRNSRGAEVYRYDPWIDDNGDCDIDAPDDVTITETFYDGLGRVRRTLYDDDDSSPSEVSFSYEPLRTIKLDEQDNANEADSSAGTIVDTDGLGRLVRSRRTLDTTGAGHEVAILWDDLGSVRGFRDANGNQKVQTRDLLGRVTQVVDPDQGTWAFTYNADNLPERVERADGHVIRREYDDLGRKTAEWDEDDEAATRATFSYDKADDCPAITCSFTAHRLVKTTYPLPEVGEGTDVFGYDERGQIITSARIFGDIALMQHAVYDNAGRQLEHVYPGDRSLTFSLDGLGRTTGIDGFLSDLAYNDRGLLSSYTYANGVRTDMEFDRRQRLTRLSATGPGDSAVVDLAFERNRVGNILGIDDGAVPSGGASLSARYTVDAVSRLVEAQLDPDGDADTLTFEYDELERLVSRVSSLGAASEGHIGDYSYDGDAPRGATRIGEVDLDYDAAGQVTRRGEATLSRDYRGRITEVSEGDEVVAQFGFNSAANRVFERFGGGRHLILHETFEVRDGVSRIRFGLDGNELVEVEADDIMTDVLPDGNDDGVINAGDAWLARNSDDAGTTLRGAARRLLLGEAGEQVTFLHNDHLGSTIAVTGDDGEVRERIAYFPQGQVRVSTAVQTEYASYVGHDVDAGTGFIHFGARALSPVDGRWLSPDPTFLVLEASMLERVADAINVFTYALDNAVSAYDFGGMMTTGEKVVTGLEVTGAAIGVAAVVVGGVAMGAAIGAATCGVANVVGAVVGGVVNAVTESILQFRQAKKDKAAGKPWSWGKVAKGVGMVLLHTAMGVTAGFASGGLSVIARGVGFSASVAQQEGLISTGEATAIRVLTLGATLGMQIGDASFGGANDNIDAASINGGPKLVDTPVKAVDITVGTSFDTVSEAAEKSTLAKIIDGDTDANGDKYTVKRAIKKDWKKSRTRKIKRGIANKWRKFKQKRADKKAAKAAASGS
jgi:RHS repeat-associated protein